MSEILIKAEHVSKKFCRDLKTSLWSGVKDLSGELLGKKKKEVQDLRNKEFWSVNDINFEVKRGECLGLIGRNGAGKSTLLKMLNGLIKPDRGRIEMHGRVGALIELGAGFNPILTGRENIYNNAAILGFSKAETHERLDAIIEFSELSEFIDTPVQYYSSGMRVRLGFSVAAQLEPDILLIDEVLAVGDMGFVLKCFNKMDELFHNTAMVFVSHSMPQVSRICSDIIVMTNGEPVYHSNDIAEGISHYYNLFDMKPGNFIGNSEAELEHIHLTSGNKSSETTEHFEIHHGDALDVHITVRLNKPMVKPRLGLMFYDKESRNFGEVFNFDDYILIEQAEGHLSFVARFQNMQFGQGVYSITVGLTEFSDDTRKSVFRIQSAIYFTVVSKKHGWAPMQFEPIWERLEK